MSTDAGESPAPLTCDFCDAPLESGQATHLAEGRFAHVRWHECAAVFRTRLAALATERDVWRTRAEAAGSVLAEVRFRLEPNAPMAAGIDPVVFIDGLQRNYAEDVELLVAAEAERDVMRARATALEEENAALRERVAELTQELAGLAALWESHFPASNEVEPVRVTVASTIGPNYPFDWYTVAAGHNRIAATFDGLIAAAQIPPTPPACLECGRPAEVEVAAAGHLRPLCWECSGCKSNYWLPDRWACFLCGKAASAQATHGDGLTRPVCAWCIGTDATEEE